MTLADRIIDMLGAGLPGNVVASAVGCDPSYISQLMDSEEVRTVVAEKRATRAEEGVKRDGKWDRIEDLALDRAQQMLPLVSKPSELIRIAQMANAAKRRSVESAGVSDSTAPTVVLNLPATAAVHFQLNNQSQVIAVDGRSMIALPTQHLAKMVAPPLEEVERVEEMAIPAAKLAEKKKIASTLEAIGYADEPPAIRNVMEQA